MPLTSPDTSLQPCSAIFLFLSIPRYIFHPHYKQIHHFDHVPDPPPPHHTPLPFPHHASPPPTPPPLPPRTRTRPPPHTLCRCRLITPTPPPPPHRTNTLHPQTSRQNAGDCQNGTTSPMFFLFLASHQTLPSFGCCLR
jgi:hypothetical protein